MEEINWDEVAEGIFDSLERLMFSGSTSLRQHGLRELQDVIAGKFSSCTVPSLPLSMDLLTL